MPSGLRDAWTKIVTAEDYDRHMTAIGQAQAAAALTSEIVHSLDLPAASRILIVGAGTGQMLDFIDPNLLKPFQIICTDLNPVFLTQLHRRAAGYDFPVRLVADDFENTSLMLTPGFLLATLVLEHIDWRNGIQTIATLAPATCAIISQENPPDMESAVTPGRCVPASIAEAFRVAQPALLPHDDMLDEFAKHKYYATKAVARKVADGKRLIATVLERSATRPNALVPHSRSFPDIRNR